MHAAERFYVELAPRYVRLRHQLGYRTLYGRRRLGIVETLVVKAMEEADEPLEPVQVGLSPDDPDYDLGVEAAAEKAEQKAAEMEYLASLAQLRPGAIEEYITSLRFEAANQAAVRAARSGSQGHVGAEPPGDVALSALPPLRMLGDRPLWITLTYPGDWRRWVPDGATLERHRRALGEAWYRGFGERPVRFWAKEFQLAEGRPHLHLLMKGPDSMPDADYRSFQTLTRLGNQNVRKHGKHDGRWWTPPIGLSYGGDTAVELLRCWSNIITGGTVPNHARRGVNVRTVFYAHSDQVAEDMRRSAIAAYMAGEAAKSGQKVPPDGFGTVGRYFGTFGHRAGFKPTVDLLEVEADVWGELNRRLTLLDALRKQARGRQVSESAKRRRPWQGLTVGGIGPEEYATLNLRAHAAAIRKTRNPGSRRCIR